MDNYDFSKIIKGLVEQLTTPLNEMEEQIKETREQIINMSKMNYSLMKDMVDSTKPIIDLQKRLNKQVSKIIEISKSTKFPIVDIQDSLFKMAKVPSYDVNVPKVVFPRLEKLIITVDKNILNDNTYSQNLKQKVSERPKTSWDQVLMILITLWTMIINHTDHNEMMDKLNKQTEIEENQLEINQQRLEIEQQQLEVDKQNLELQREYLEYIEFIDPYIPDESGKVPPSDKNLE